MLKVETKIMRLQYRTLFIALCQIFLVWGGFISANSCRQKRLDYIVAMRHN